MKAFGPNTNLKTPPLSKNLQVSERISQEYGYTVRCDPGGFALYHWPWRGLQVLLRPFAPFVQRFEERFISCKVRQLALCDGYVLTANIRLQGIEEF
jgi:hypothetical protein